MIARAKVLRVLALVAMLLCLPLFAFVHLLGALGVVFAQWPASAGLRDVLGWTYGILLVFALIKYRPFWRTAALSLLAPFVIWLLYGLIHPKTDGKYPPETSRASTVSIVGDHATIHDVRDFVYRSETDFDARWEDRTYDLTQIRTTDLTACWWTEGQQIAHTMVSFGFADGTYVICSIEIRREEDEVYGPIDGLYRRYELIYVWGDERDLIGLRTNYRKEEVRLYRTTLTPDESRRLFVEYLRETAAIAAEPVFYNTFTRNCTSCIGDRINASLDRGIPWYRRRLRNGLTDQRAFDLGWLVGDQSAGFAPLRARSCINERAQAVGARAPDFSAQIRAHFTH